MARPTQAELIETVDRIATELVMIRPDTIKQRVMIGSFLIKYERWQHGTE
jgi:hypothetical protein